MTNFPSEQNARKSIGNELMPIDRRNFIRIGLYGGFVFSLSDSALGEARTSVGMGSVLLISQDGALFNYRLSDKSLHLFCPQGGGEWHSVSLSPDKTHAAAFSKYGEESYILNTKENGFTKFKSLPGYVFYGHGAFGEQVIFTTESTRSNDQGIVTVRDRVTGKMLEKWESGGIRPHDLYFDRSKNVVMIANSGPIVGGERTEANVAILDAKNGKCIARMATDNIDQAPAHFINIANSEEVVLGCIPKVNATETPGSIMTAKRGADFTSVKISKEQTQVIKNEALSLAIDEKESTVAVTYPRSNHVAFLDFNSKSLMGHYTFSRPRGVIWHAESQSFLILHESPDGFAHLTWLARKGDQILAVNTQPIPTMKSMAHLVYL